MTRGVGAQLAETARICQRCGAGIYPDEYWYVVEVQWWSDTGYHYWGECIGCAEGRGVICPEHNAELRDCIACGNGPTRSDFPPLTCEQLGEIMKRLEP